MSKQNKVNKNNYDQAGRLTPDDMARERQKMQHETGRPSREPVKNRVPERPAQRGGQESNRPRSAPEE